MAKTTYTVLREHWGDKDGKRYRFKKGETRHADPASVQVEVERKILGEPGPAAAKA